MQELSRAVVAEELLQDPKVKVNAQHSLWHKAQNRSISAFAGRRAQQEAVRARVAQGTVWHRGITRGALAIALCLAHGLIAWRLPRACAIVLRSRELLAEI